MEIAEFLQLLVNGIAVGSIIALSAVGLTLVCGILKLSNFAHGDFMTLGAYLTWAVNSQGLNLGLSAIIGATGTIVAMIISEQVIWKPMRDRRATSTTLMIISIGLALFIRNGILLIWGGSNQLYDVPLVAAPQILGVNLAYDRLLTIGLAVMAIIALHFLLQKTKIGKAMRAVADNVDLARVSGINVEKVVFWTWILAGIVTALGGIMYGLITGGIRPNMGWFLILPIFAAVILGGIGNPYGAITGGLIIGVAQELVIGVAQAAKIPWLAWLGFDYKLAVALFIMIVLLLVRPQGLFTRII